MKVRYLKGDTAGQEGFLDYHSVQAALQSDPDSIEILDGQASVEAGEVDQALVKRHPAAPRDLSDEGSDETLAGARGSDAGDAMRIGPSVVSPGAAEDDAPAGEDETASSRRSRAKKS